MKSKDFPTSFKERSLREIISLNNISLDIKRGSLTVIVGPTGSGKSSLLNTMIGELTYLPEDI